MGQNSITMFTNDTGGAASSLSYIQDAFTDVTDTPSTNSGFSSTISNNPMNNLYGNDDFPRFGPKTLWIKDLVLEPNRANWVNGEPTYRIIWNENYPSAQGYVFGNIQIIRPGTGGTSVGDLTYIKVKSVGDGFGVGGVFARAMFLMVGNTASAGSATGTVFLDGSSNATSVDWSNLASGNPLNTPMYAATVHANANETYNIHDFRLTANQAGAVFTIAGVIVYSENSTLSIDQFPGITYNNKVQSKTITNSTLSVPSYGSSLGGIATIWKTSSSGYSLSALGVTTITSNAQGSSGTNILNVTTGQGASFSSGYGIVSSFGTSMYVGVIQSISTDALTVYPTLPFGISNTIYRYFQSGQSLAINASFNILAYTFGSTEILRSGFTALYLDPMQKFAVWSQNTGATFIDGIWNSVAFASAAGFLQCEGYFSAAEIEWIGMSFSVLSGTMVVNGLPTYNHNNIGFTGVLKKTVFMEAGPGWNNFAFFPGSSHINVGINRINLYRRSRDISASFGILGSFETLQSFIPRANNATFIAPGAYKRTFSDQLLFKGPWVRATGATLPGGVAYIGSTTTCTLQFQYYGTHFSVVGGSFGIGGSMNISLDAGSNQGSTALNVVVQGTSNTFHSVSLAVLGGTNIISCIDFFRPYSEMTNLQNFAPLPALAASQPKVPIITDWVSYTPVNTGFGTLTSVTVLSRRVGDTLEIIGSFVTGTTSGASATITVGYNGNNANVLIDTSKIVQAASTNMIVGYATIAVSTANTYTVLVSSGAGQQTTLFFGVTSATTAGASAASGSQISGGSQQFTFFAKVPIQGWTATT